MVDRELVIKFVGRDGGLQSTAATATDEVKGLGSSAQTTQQDLQQLAVASGAFSAAIGGVFLKSTQEFVTLDNAIKQSGVVSGSIGTAQLGELREEVERLGIVTSKAPADIAQTSVALSRAGFTAQETTVALEGITRASEATGEALGTVGNITARTVRTFGLAADESGRIGDILVATANNTNTTVASIGESLSFVGAVASASNQPVEDIAIAIGLLGDAGIDGSAAGTNLAAALEALKQASAGVDSEFTNLVRGNAKRVEAFQLIQSEVRNADGSLKSIIEILPVLRESLGSLSQQDQDIIFKALFGTQGGRAIQTLLNTTDERLQDVTQTIRGAEGAANEAGEAMLQGLGGALDLLQGSAGATLAKFGELAALGLEPLVRSATAVLNSFLALPAPLQAAVVGVTGFTGALAGAIALLATYQALQIGTRAVTIANTAATVGLTAAQQINAAVLTASAVANAVLNAELTKENVSLGINAVATRAAATAKQLYAVATGQASAATLAFVGRLALLAAQAALAAGAVFAVAQVFKRSEGAQFASDITKAVDELGRFQGQADEAVSLTDDLADSFGRFFDNLRDLGPVEATQAAIVDLQSAILGTADSTDRLGSSILQIGSFEFGPLTRSQRGAQIATIATSKALAKLGTTVEDTISLLSQFDQVGVGRALNPAEVIEFTDAVGEQVKVLQQEIDLLETQQGQSAELDAQLQGEINTRQRLISTLEGKVEAQNGDTEAVKAARDATRELGEVLDDLGDKYDRLQTQLDINADNTLADIANREAEGLINQAQAEQERLTATSNALGERIRNNNALLAELERQREQRTDEGEIQEIDDEILKVNRQLAQDERKLAEDRARGRRDEAKAQEDATKKAADDAKKAEQEKLKAVEDAATEAISIAAQAENERLILLERTARAEGLTKEETELRKQQFTIDRIKAELKAEQDKVAALVAAGGPESEIRKAKEQTSALTLALLRAEQQAQEAAAEVAITAINERQTAASAAATRTETALARERQLIESVNAAYDRQVQLAQARANLQDAIESAIQSEFDIAIRLTSNEEEKARLQERAAIARVQGLERSQQLELAIFDLQQQQLGIQLRIQQAQLAGEQARNRAEQTRAQAELERLQARQAEGLQVSQSDFDVAQANLEAAQQVGRALLAQSSELAAAAQNQAQISVLNRQARVTEQQTARSQARADLIGSVQDERTRERLAEQERRSILGSGLDRQVSSGGLDRANARDIAEIFRGVLQSNDRAGSIGRLQSSATGNLQAGLATIQPGLAQPVQPVASQPAGGQVLDRPLVEELIGELRTARTVVNQTNEVTQTFQSNPQAGQVQTDIQDEVFAALDTVATELKQRLS
ncbi:MAG: phage tail tape measure protein [Cyanobacteria bacterium P01_A01_bin.17]